MADERPTGSRPDARSTHDAVVYDLDGTLVRLAVDWSTVERQVSDVFVSEGLDPDELVAWELLDEAERHGFGDRVHRLIERHELAGARDAERLGTAEDLLADGMPSGVVSLNAEAAVEVALETAGLADAVDVVVGRDSVRTRKPHPRPLLAALEELAVDPVDALFVGDSETDEETARRAGVAFEYV
ncbi:MAG: HAD family hydrolase [Halanaeroarchaeum sp.]